MRRLLLAVLLLVLVPAAARAAAPLPLPEGASSGVDLMGNIPEATQAVAINFIRYEDGRDVMFVSTYHGLLSYDLTTDPTNPTKLGELTSAALKQPGDLSDQF